jgi:hypothetical protein
MPETLSAVPSLPSAPRAEPHPSDSSHAPTQPPQLAARVGELVHACFSGIYIETQEPDEALRELALLARRESWRLGAWDCETGLSLPDQHVTLPDLSGVTDPLAVLRAAGALSEGAGTTLLVFRNLHRFLGATEMLEALARQVASGKHTRTFIVILAPVVILPPEIEKQFIVVEHELPSREQLHEIAAAIAQGDEMPDGPALAGVLDSAAGLTRYEAEGAFSLSIVRHGRLEAACVWNVKSQQLKKSGLVTIHRGEESFATLGGLDRLKQFCRQAMRPRSPSDQARRERPRGVLLLSPPGCGKSQFAKALGNETGRPTVVLDIGALLGSLVGQSESNVRAALKLADAMAPCVLFCDELEKALAGASGSGQSDSGVTSRVFGALLTWLNDHQSDVFFVGTCNDVSRLPPEFARAERFDGVFFLDLPDRQHKDRIWEICLELHGLSPDESRPDDPGWTGAEIKACCRLARLLDVPLAVAAEHVVPVALTAHDRIEALRQWASGRCLSADRAGVYVRPSSAPAGTGTARRALGRQREPA